MATRLITAAKPLHGEITPPPDKSISHRALLFSALAAGRSRIRSLLQADDVARSNHLIQALGVKVSDSRTEIVVESPGRKGLLEPESIIDCGNSGTTMRLGAGLLAALPFVTFLTGDASLRRRPMSRIIEPLERMGISVKARARGLPPLCIIGGAPKSMIYELPVASAQVKSAILLAGLAADGPVSVLELNPTRDHTERMLTAMDAQINRQGSTITLRPGRMLQVLDVTVPGDISSAAFFLAAAAIIPRSELTIKRVGLNPTRLGFVEVLQAMGAHLTLTQNSVECGEPVGDIEIRQTPLTGITIPTEKVPSFIDEVMLAALVATQASGITTIDGLTELRVKESDRLAAIVESLRTLGARVAIGARDSLQIEGPVKLQGGALKAYGDHRMAMVAAIAALAAKQVCTLDDPSVVGISYPGFFEDLGKLIS